MSETPPSSALRRRNVIVGSVAFGFFAGLVAWAVVRIRDSGDRHKCSNNLKQLAIGIHNYHDTNGSLPSLIDSKRQLVSAFAVLIPYLESTPFFHRPEGSAARYHGHSSMEFDFREKDGTIGHFNGGIVNWSGGYHIDPADRTADNLRDVQVTLPDGSTGHYAPGSYAFNGVLVWGEGSRSIPALGETILIAERPQVCRHADGSDTPNLWGVGFYDPRMSTFATLVPKEMAGSTGQIAPAGEGMVRIGRADAEPVEGPAFPIQRIRGRSPCDPRLPGASHRTGMNAALADGSVRFFRFDTPAAAFWEACSP